MSDGPEDELEMELAPATPALDPVIASGPVSLSPLEEVDAGQYVGEAYTRQPTDDRDDPAWYCGAHGRHREAPCRNRAGFKTDHVGIGKCHLHGGRSLVYSGRYSKVKNTELRALIEQMEKDPDPLNVLPDLALARAMLHDFIERYHEWREAIFAWHHSFDKPGSATRPRQILDISDAINHASTLAKMVESIQRGQAIDAIPRPEFLRILRAIGEIVNRHTDPDTMAKIQKEVGGLRF